MVAAAVAGGSGIGVVREGEVFRGNGADELGELDAKELPVVGGDDEGSVECDGEVELLSGRDGGGGKEDDLADSDLSQAIGGEAEDRLCRVGGVGGVDVDENSAARETLANSDGVLADAEEVTQGVADGLVVARREEAGGGEQGEEGDGVVGDRRAGRRRERAVAVEVLDGGDARGGGEAPEAAVDVREVADS